MDVLKHNSRVRNSNRYCLQLHLLRVGFKGSPDMTSKQTVHFNLLLVIVVHAIN